MNHRWMRLLSALLCMALLFGVVPSWAEPDAAREDNNTSVEAVETAPNPTQAPPEPTAAPTPEPTAAPTEAPTEEPVQATEAPESHSPEANPEDTPLPEEDGAVTLEDLVATWRNDLKAQKFSDDYHKALWLYDRLIARLSRGSANDALSALSTRSASPLGYALAYEALLEAAGIECVTVSVKDTAWNVAKLDGAWTHIDVLMDDAPDCFGRHFGLTDAAMALDHSWDAKTVPACTDARSNYFVREKNYSAFAGRDALAALLSSEVERRTTKLGLFSAGEQLSIVAVVNALLPDIDPAVRAEVSARGCYATVRLYYADSEATAAPDTDATAAATIEPVVTVETTSISDAATPAPEMEVAPIPESIAPIAAPTMEIAPVPERIAPVVASLTLGIGEETSVDGGALLSVDDGDAVEYSSESSKVASVDENGNIVAKKTGSTRVTMAAASGAIGAVEVTVKAAPTSIKIVADRTVFGVGEPVTLGYTRSPSNSAGEVTFSVPKDQNIAEITKDGVLTLRNPGFVTVTATTYNNIAKSIDIEVKAAPSSVTLSAESISLGKGDTWTPGCELSEGSASKVTFTSDKPWIASVDPDTGLITAVDIGKATITASAFNGKHDSLDVEVVAAPKSIVLTAPRTSIGVKESIQLKPVMNGFTGELCTLKYKSSNTSVAKVNATTGEVTAKKAGSATITVTAYNKAKATLKITVKAAPSSVKIVVDRKVLGVGESMDLGYTLSSGSKGHVSFSVPKDQNVAEINTYETVADNGKVTEHNEIVALHEGVVTVTAETYNGKSKSVDIEVKAAPSSVTLSAESISLGKGDTWTPGYELSEGSASKVTFTSDKPWIASVDPDTGLITAVDIGKATITASAFNGKHDSLDVEVVAAPKSIVLTAPRTSIGVKESIQLKPVMNGFAGELCTLKYKSSNTSVAKVNATTGEVTAKKAGSATITVTAYNKAKATLKITVKAAPTSVKIVVDRTVLGVGEFMDLGYTLSSGSKGHVSFSVPKDQNVAEINTYETVADNGKVTEHNEIIALNEGVVTVTAETYNGKSKSVDIEVKAAPSSVTLSAESISLGKGDTWTPGYELSEGSASKVTFTSDKPWIASVNPDTGLITAVDIGKATITVDTHNSKHDSLDVEVVAAPKSIVLTAPRTSIGVKESIQLRPVMNGFTGEFCTLKYKSSDTSVAKVDATTGEVTAKKAGSATITVTAYNKAKATLKITVKAAPSSVKIVVDRKVLGVGESMDLGYTLSSGSKGHVSFSVPKDQNVAEIITHVTVADDGKVTERNEITALNEGVVTVTAETYNGKSKSVDIEVKAAPKAIALTVPEELGEGQTVDFTYTLEPEDSHTTPKYRIVSGNAVEIDKNGKLYAAHEGEAVICADTHVDGVFAEKTITVKPAPKSISFDKTEYAVDINETYQLTPTLTKGSVAGLTYSISKTGYFTIDETGLITPIQRGSSKVTVKTHNKLSASTTVWVVDPSYPEILRLEETPPEYMHEGEVYQPLLYVFPETAVPEIVWTSSNPSVASVDTVTGEVHALSYGRTTIKGKSSKNTKLSVSYQLVVLSDERSLIMPTHRTKTGAIDATLQQIKSVQDSAYRELDELVAKGWISSSEKSTRKGYVKRAFEMYLFPWMTNSTAPYWRAANSEGGMKDFKPGTVYYGVPYTQNNRVNTPSSMINAGYYKDSGKGYYLMQTNRFSSRMYPGSDCSSFVSMAIWGTGSGRKSDTTRTIASASYYTTLASKHWNDLRPGDLICKGGSHVVMFLYYANKDKSQIVVIEQGGGGNDLYSNCVSTSLRDVSHYKNSGYSIRRVVGLNMDYMK